MIIAIVAMLSWSSGFQASALKTHALADVYFSEWSVPTPASGLRALTLDPAGTCCWFTEYYGNKIAHLNPINNTISEWQMPTSNANPYDLAPIIISGSLILWGTEAGTDTVFAFFPNLGLFREYSLSQYKSGSLGVAYISAEPPDSKVRVWLTEIFNNANGELVYDPATSNVTYYSDRFPPAVGGGAYGVYAASNSVWYAGFSALVRWDRASQQYTMWPLPSHGSAVGRSITLDRNGQPWYTQGATNKTGNDNFVGVLRGNSTFQDWRLPSSGSDPRGISINPLTQQPWVAEQSQAAGNGAVAVLSAFDGGTLVSSSPTTAPSGGTPTILAPVPAQVAVSIHTVTPTTSSILVSHKEQFAEYARGPTLPSDAIVDSSGNIWVSEPGTNKIARLTFGPDFALLASPPTISAPQGGAGTVTLTATSISGYTGQVTLATTTVPRGVTISSFTPNPLNIPSGGTTSSTFTVNIASGASAGTNTIIIQGTNGTMIHEVDVMLTITNTTSSTPNGPKCLIATATYGSELSPEVQLLRNFRDNSLQKTKIGSSFLVVFNAWYYSFSPFVASYIENHEIARAGMKAFLYPLIAFIYLSSRLFTALSLYPELAAVLSGLLACSLIGAFYVGLPCGLLLRRLRLTWKLDTKTMSVLPLAGISAVLIGQMLSSAVLLITASSILVLSFLFASAVATAATVSRSRFKRPVEYSDSTLGELQRTGEAN